MHLICLHLHRENQSTRHISFITATSRSSLDFSYSISRVWIWIAPELINWIVQCFVRCRANWFGYCYPALRPRPRLRPVGPKSTPLLRIQKPAIIERRGSRPINSTTSFTIDNCVDRSTRRKPSASERNTMDSHFHFRDASTNKSNARDILT